jgi:uncharacterized phiE125 gp8 family phage protein
MLTLVTAPQELPVSLQEVKAAGRLEDEDDALLAGHLRAAVAAVDGSDGWLNRALISQVWIKWLDAFPWTIRMPLPPLQEVVEVRYVDTDGNVQVVDPSVYVVAGIGGYGRIVPALGQRWPATRCQPDAVQVEFKAGYGDDWNAVPQDIRDALILSTVALYDGCESAAATEIFMRYRAW